MHVRFFHLLKNDKYEWYDYIAGIFGVFTELKYAYVHSSLIHVEWFHLELSIATMMI